jgi:hypothetical protein
MPIYPQRVVNLGTCFDFLLFRCFHFKLTFESIKDLESTSIVLANFYIFNNKCFKQNFITNVNHVQQW